MSTSQTAAGSFSQLNSIDVEPAQFRVTGINEAKCSLASYNRRDYFKISLVTQGCSQLLYAKNGIDIKRPALVFTTPMVPYSWTVTADSEEASGYFCVFTDKFLQSAGRIESLSASNLFKAGGDPVYFLDDAQLDYISRIFIRMREEADSQYIYKHDLIRNHVNLLIHEAMKMQPAIAYFTPPNAAARVTKLFLELLERQFPVDRQEHTLQLKKPSEYADKLAVHVNHLNAAVQETTGKSTTTHIQERIIGEAKSLLMHTDWNITEVAFSLGFDYTSYFNKFFKKHTGTNPAACRKIL